MGDTRERIVAAAKRIVVAGSGAKPSVRTVAAEAGVGASTLRYYFPTQRALLDAVLESVYAEALPDEGIDVLFNPGAPASMRIETAALKRYAAQPVEGGAEDEDAD